jgi:hypothetical protein
MADTPTRSRDLLTPYGRLSFVNLFVAKPTMDGKGDPRYSTNLIIPEPQMKTQAFKDLQEAIIACAEENFGKDWRKKQLRMPIRKGSEREQEGYGDDCVFIAPWTVNKPTVLDREGNPILVPDDVFPGQVARISVRPFSYDKTGNKGVALGLNHVQIVVADMQRLDGRKSAKEVFKEPVADYDTLSEQFDFTRNFGDTAPEDGMMDDLLDSQR